MARARISKDGLMFWCPGCKAPHFLSNQNWSNNGDCERPTSHGASVGFTYGNGKVYKRCHFVLRAGLIYYWPDSTHKLSEHYALMPEEKEWHPDADFQDSTKWSTRDDEVLGVLSNTNWKQKHSTRFSELQKKRERRLGQPDIATRQKLENVLVGNKKMTPQEVALLIAKLKGKLGV